MPAKSRSQRIVAAIAEHSPEKLYAKNRGMLSMSHEQLSHFASTKEKGLPTLVPKPKRMVGKWLSK